MCESCTPPTSMSRSPALIRPRWLFASSQPAAAMPSPSSAHGRSGPCRSFTLLSYRYRSGFFGTGEYRSFEPYTKTPGRSSKGPSDSRRGATERLLAIESPVLITRSGSSASSVRRNESNRCRPGVRCRSEKCSIRSGLEPGGSTGTSYRRSANQLRSITAAYPSTAAPATAALPARACGRIPLCCHASSIGPSRTDHQDGRPGRISVMAELKDRLRADLTASMKDRDAVRTRTLRMVLTEIAKEEVSGAASRELHDAEIERVLAREAKRRREAAEAFSGAGRADQASVELAEGHVLAAYLPEQLDDAELAALVTAAIAESGATGPGATGQVMKAVNPKIAGRAEGSRVAAEVRRQLTAT